MGKDNKNKMGILLVILLYIIAIFSTANITKNIGKKEEKQTKLEEKNQKDIKDISEKEKEVLIENVDKTLETLEKNEEEEIEESSKEIFEKNISYIKLEKKNVYSDKEGKNKVDTLNRGTRVEILGEEDIEIIKIKKIKQEDGTFKEVEEIETKKMCNISYSKDRKNHTVWVEADGLEKNINSILPKYLEKISFSPVEKKEYPNNPRVKVKGIYLSVHTVSSARLDELISFAKRVGINAFVIDVKEDFGKMLFKTEAEEKYLGRVEKSYPISDIYQLMKKLKDNNIYTIARIVSFKDPSYAQKYPNKAIIKKSTGQPFTNSDGVIWVSAHDRNLWEYNIAVAKEAAKVGFNEIQFDYVRFPASNGGKLDVDLDYRNYKNESKPETIQKYLEYARKELEPLEVYISADIYGQVGSVNDDMGLGQYWEAISNVVDVISPMAYPSHYGKGVYGLAVPDAQPYKTIYYSTLDGINRNNNVENPAHIRPWLQAFTAKWVKGYIPYGKAEIEAQVKALKDLGIEEYLLWSPSNRYGMVEK